MGVDTTEETQKVAELSKQIAATQEQIADARMVRDKALGRIGNIISDTTPVAKDEVRLEQTLLCRKTTLRSRNGVLPVR